MDRPPHGATQNGAVATPGSGGGSQVQAAHSAVWGRFFFATVSGVFCDSWVFADSNGCFLRRRRLRRGFLRQFTNVHGFFATVLYWVLCDGAIAAEVFLGVSQRSTVEEEEKEPRRRRRRRVTEPSLWQRCLMAERLDR